MEGWNLCRLGTKIFWLSICVRIGNAAPSRMETYVGTGYDILRGHPFGESVASSGVDPGLSPSRRIFQATYATSDATCPAEHTCVSQDGSAEVHTAAIYFDMIDYQIGLNRSWGSGIEVDLTGSNLSLADYLMKFGGSLSNDYGNMKARIEREYKIFIDNSTTKLYAEAALNFRSKGVYTAEFLAHLCELPTEYSEIPYRTFLRMWGTHVITRVRLGARELARHIYTGQNVTEFLSKTQKDCVSTGGSILKFFSGNVDRTSSSLLISQIRKDVKEEDTRRLSSGSQQNPVPITMELVPMDFFISERFIRPTVVEELSHLKCDLLLNDTASLCLIRVNMERAVRDYPALEGAVQPEPIWRNYTLPPPPVINYWPQGSYSMLQPSVGCPSPSNEWATGWRSSGMDGIGYASSDFSLLAEISVNSFMTMNFCTKTGAFTGSAGREGSWPAGSYCIFKYGTCPSGFSPGTFYNDDEDSWCFWSEDCGYSTSGGTLPSGSYREGSTLYEFCCRDDGNPTSPIALPLTPFILLPTASKQQCQAVTGMTGQMHHVQWVSENHYNNYASGIYTTQSGKRWDMYFCYYYPSRMSRGWFERSSQPVCSLAGYVDRFLPTNFTEAPAVNAASTSKFTSSPPPSEMSAAEICRLKESALDHFGMD